jgi:hypothetical protein
MVKYTLEQFTKAQRWIIYASFTSSLDDGWWSKPRPGHCTPEKYSVPIVKEAGCGKPRTTPAFKLIYVKEI